MDKMPRYALYLTTGNAMEKYIVRNKLDELKI